MTNRRGCKAEFTLMSGKEITFRLGEERAILNTETPKLQFNMMK